MWPSLPLIFDSYVIEFSREMEKEVPSLKNIHFGNKLFKRQDPELVLYIHFQLLNFVSYTHESSAEEEVYRNPDKTLEEVSCNLSGGEYSTEKSFKLKWKKRTYEEGTRG